MHQFRVLLHLPPEAQVALESGHMERIGGVIMEWHGPEDKGRVAWLVREMSTTPGLLENVPEPVLADWSDGLLPAGMASGVNARTLGRISETEEMTRPVWERFEGALVHGEEVTQLLEESGHRKESKALESVLMDLESAMKQNDPETAGTLLADAIQKSLGVLEVLENEIQDPSSFEDEPDLDLSAAGKSFYEISEVLILLEAYSFVSGVLVRVLAESGRIEEAMQAAQTTGEYVLQNLENVATAILMVDPTRLMDRVREVVERGFKKALDRFLGITQDREEDEGPATPMPEDDDRLVYQRETLLGMLHPDVSERIPASRMVGILRIVDEDLDAYDVLEMLRGTDLTEYAFTDDDLEMVEAMVDLMDRVRDAADKLQGYALELEYVASRGMTLQSYREALASAISQRLSVVPELPALLFVEIFD